MTDAMGLYSAASADYANAMGIYSAASADYANAIGSYANVSAAYSVALGSLSVADREAGMAGYDPVTGDKSADFTVEFEPSATALEKEGAGYVVASLGVDSGYVPYTSYSAKTSYMEKNPEIIQKFTNALQKGMEYVQSHTPEEIAEVIAPQFAETDLDIVTTIVKRYYEQDTWKSDLIFEKESFELLEDILEDAGELNEHVSYKDLVTTEYAAKAAEK